MTYPYVGDFLLSPIPLQLSFNYCSHKCSYCFANLNNPGRTFDVKEFQAQLKGIYTNNSLPSLLLREKYPVLLSNLVDPFATSNYGVAVPTIEMLTELGIPVSIQTRGGRGVDDVLSFLPTSVWYLSIPMLNDEIRKTIEPAAPSIPSRLELIDKLRAKGHPVVVGVNPTFSEWLPGNDSIELVNVLAAKGVHGIWVNPLHFNTRQVQRMPDKDKARIGETAISKGLKNARVLQKDCLEFITNMTNYALSKGLCVEGLFACHENHFFQPYYNVYGDKTFPTTYNFINWCYKNKKDNEQVFYSEFEALMMKGLPAGKHNISPYMRCMSAKLDDEIRKTDGYKQTFQYLLDLCWNDHRMKRMMDRFWTFAYSVNDKAGEVEYNRDTEGNLIFHFNRVEYEDEFFIYNH